MPFGNVKHPLFRDDIILDFSPDCLPVTEKHARPLSYVSNARPRGPKKAWE